MRAAALGLWLAACQTPLASVDGSPDGPTGETGPDGTATGSTGHTASTGHSTHTGEPWTIDTRADLVDWVSLAAGTYTMGTAPPEGDETERPPHPVTLPDFELSRTEVTVDQFQACVDAGACDPLVDPAPNCGGIEDLGTGQVQACLDWYRAVGVCRFLGGRLPTEAEWEYAARSQGQDREYPWGDDEPTCELARLGTSFGCPGNATIACSHPDGNTEQGLCDMAGNVFEWVQDWFVADYQDASPLGEPPAVPDPGDFRTMRGGGVGSGVPVRTRQRTFHPPDWTYGGMGVRCARGETAW